MSTNTLKRKSDILDTPLPLSTTTTTTTTSENIFSPEELSLYYNNYYPFYDLSNWLIYNSNISNISINDIFKNREFSMTLKDDIYLRFKSYNTWVDWKKDVVEKYPIKIDIGAIYNAPPITRQAINNFIPLQKELVFDIDMTDYDDIRKCCDGAKICKDCWVLMTAAVDGKLN